MKRANKGLFYTALFVAGVVSTVLLYEFLENSIEFIAFHRDAAKASGTIVTVKKNPFEGDSMRVINVTFNIDGKNYFATNRFKTNVLQTPFEVGESIGVFYLKDNPNCNKVDLFIELYGTVLFSGIGFFIFFTIFLLTIVNKEWVEAQEGGMWPW